MKKAHRTGSAIALLVLSSCITNADIAYYPHTIPTSLQAQPYEPEPAPIEWPRSKNGKGIMRNDTTTYDYEDDRDYKVRVCFGKSLSYFYLQPGERYTGESPTVFGDSANSDNWTVAAKVAGQTQIIAVWARSAGQQSSMMITTNIREYTFELTAGRPCQKKIKFAFQPTPQPRKPQPIQTYDPGKVNAAYSVKLDDGNNPVWMPLGAFDMGGTKTWIEFPGKPGTVGLPTILLGNGDGPMTPATSRIDGNFVEVDAQISRAELKLDGSKVIIERISK